MNRRNAFKHLLAVPAVLGSAAALLACSEPAPTFTAVDSTGADYAKGFELTDQYGKLRHLGDFAGKVVVMFFGYTQCPDVCPTTMAGLAQVKKALGPDGERLQALFVTVDPERDTPEVLKGYMANFDPSFIALYTTPDKLKALATDYKVYYKKVEGRTPDSYSMDHSAGSYIYDTKGQLRLFGRFDQTTESLTKDIAQLLKQAA